MGTLLCSVVLYHIGSSPERIIKSVLHKYPSVSILWEETGNKKEGRSISTLYFLLDLSLRAAQSLLLPCLITPLLKEFKTQLHWSEVTFPLKHIKT